jgi:hypothetical protein
MSDRRLGGRRQTAIYVAILLVLLLVQSLGAAHFMDPRRSFVMVLSVLLGTAMGLLAVVQYIGSASDGSPDRKRGFPRLLTWLKHTVPPVLVSGLIVVCIRRFDAMPLGGGILSVIGGILSEGIWLLLLSVTTSMLVGILASERGKHRSQREHESP